MRAWPGMWRRGYISHGSLAKISAIAIAGLHACIGTVVLDMVEQRCMTARCRGFSGRWTADIGGFDRGWKRSLSFVGVYYTQPLTDYSLLISYKDCYVLLQLFFSYLFISTITAFELFFEQQRVVIFYLITAAHFIFCPDQSQLSFWLIDASTTPLSHRRRLGKQ